MAELTLTVTRLIKAPAARVFEAWTTPEQMTQWYGPESMTTPEASSENRKGGKYSVTMLAGDEEFKHSGEYLEFDPPHKLVYTWGDGTVVDVTFEARGDAETQVTLTHTGFTQKESRDGHNEGWTSTLNSLEKFVK